MKKFLVSVVVMAAAGCAPLSMIGGLSKIETFHTAERVDLPEGTSDPIRILEETGKSLGYRVSGLDRGRSYISLSASSSVLETAVISHVSEAELQFTVTADRRQADVLVVVVGNLGTGNQEKGENLLAQFKEALGKVRELRMGSK